MENRPGFTDIEIRWAIDQLIGMGYIERRNIDEVILTDAGIDYCVEFQRKLGVQDAVLLHMFHDAAMRVAKAEIEEGEQPLFGQNVVIILPGGEDGT